MIKGLIPMLCLALSGSACSTVPTAPAHPDFRVATFRVANGWAYSVYINRKEYIRQTFIPTLPGYHAFRNEHAARNTGLLVVEKLRREEGPSVTRAELVQLKVIPLNTITP